MIYVIKTAKDITILLTDKNYKCILTSDNTGVGFNYLIKMTMDSVSMENVQKLEQHTILKTNELNKLHNTSIQQLWLNELNHFAEQLEIVYPINKVKLCVKAKTKTKVKVKVNVKAKTKVK